MFLLFGFKTADRMLGMLNLACPVCGSTGGQALTRRTTRFTLFFVPLFPVRPARHHMQCTSCGAAREVSPGEAARLAR
jgi:hypothetical protein